MKTIHLYRNLTMVAVGMLNMLATSCEEDINNTASRNQSEIELVPSGEYIKLDESKPNETAVTLKWSAAHDFGEDYITTYKYEMQLIGSEAENIKEFDDDGEFLRSYTNEEMQKILVDHFGLTTSTIGEVLFTVTASFEGPRLMVPDIATATLKIKTYGPKQYKADNLYVGGSAVGDELIKMTLKDEVNKIYSYEGALVAGKINFPVDYADELNAIGPETADTPITTGEMTGVIFDRAEANSWVVPSAATYRITVNMSKQTVKIVEAGAVVEADQIFLAGSAVGEDQIEMTQALENDQIYAWRGELKAGSLYIPLVFEGNQSMAIVPEVADNHDIEDGQLTTFGQALISKVDKQYWTIPTGGTYRIVLNKEEKTITIYSATTDLKPLTVSFNNTELGINPWSQEVNVLHMYGGFNSFAYDAGTDEETGKNFKYCQVKYNLIQSVANPKIFVYKGEALPRNEYKDNYGKTNVGWVNFSTLRYANNGWFVGSTADAKRNDHNGYTEVIAGKIEKAVTGQADNRYAYFLIPEGCNYVVVDIENNTVLFDIK
ncbi:SusE domain-containing protein [uncultured Bacteroides sp.]|uniref:SusE domain-containing protein n=1 Tax=uncultured Bacteroides sp. TaxID=162156 RepID=UPI002676E74D|nr:SusE domain-containing protein [uncultured Bacteroides sp.]